MLRPLFPGNSESDMINRVCQIMGSPSNSIWPEGMKHAASRRVKFPTHNKTPLQKLMPHANADAIDMMDKMMHWHPAQRLTCRLANSYPKQFFSNLAFVIRVRVTSAETQWLSIMCLSSESLKHGYFQLDPAPSSTHTSRTELHDQPHRKSDEKKERRRGEKIVVGPSAASSLTSNFENIDPIPSSPRHAKAKMTSHALLPRAEGGDEV